MRHRTFLAGGLVLGLLLTGCGGSGDPVPDAEVDDADVEDAEVDDASDDDDDAADDGDGEELSAPADDTSGDTVMEPDAGLLADPCADHQGREADAFIDLVAPVDDQVASGEVEIVGCSNVNEATVAWMLLDGDGRTLDEGFTTAECGTGCVGAFRDTVPLSTAADEPVAYLQVFSPNVADEGPAQLELTEVIVVIG